MKTHLDITSRQLNTSVPPALNGSNYVENE